MNAARLYKDEKLAAMSIRRRRLPPDAAYVHGEAVKAREAVRNTIRNLRESVRHRPMIVATTALGLGIAMYGGADFLRARRRSPQLTCEVQPRSVGVFRRVGRGVKRVLIRILVWRIFSNLGPLRDADSDPDPDRPHSSSLVA